MSEQPKMQMPNMKEVGAMLAKLMKNLKDCATGIACQCKNKLDEYQAGQSSSTVDENKADAKSSHETDKPDKQA